ncbi:MAG: wax ester/triacylglycerol synthase family O-acyltransferase [Gammaproteobacteria bacterium]|nr:wax ester/triacylglycerol synthase family O-acyltransferase [Gammaproteobacteria bacterium]
MKQLSGMDNMFLHLEHGNQYMHVAGLGIYDPSTAAGGFVRFKDILKFFEARLDSAPVFRRRLVTVPMELDRPYWIEDPDVDVEYHVRHIALPHPGDWRQLCIQVARIHSRPLDRSKPLWEAYVIEGLDNIPGIPRGSFAFYTKFHHAAIDGEGGTEVMAAIHSFSPEEAVPDDTVRRTRVRDREPTQVELYTRALVNSVQRFPRAARFSVQTAKRLAGLSPNYMAQLKELLQEAGVPSVETVKSKLRRPPATRVSGKVSAQRVGELVGVPMAQIRHVRQKIEGATINDVFMATVGGALNKYLGAKGELPDRSMTAQVPMTLRGQDKGGDVGNQVGVAVMPLHSEIADPVERLHAIREGAEKAKALVGLVGKDLTKHVYDLLPAAASELFTRRVMLPTMNIVVSNVRGPDVPMYLAGAQMVAFAPVSIAMDGLGLNVTGFSYHGTLWMCAVACRDMMPDPAFFADCLRSSFADLVAAADARHAKKSEAAEVMPTDKVSKRPRARRKTVRRRVRAAR